MLMDVEIKNLENEIAQACRVDGLSVTRQDMDNQTLALEYCYRGFVTLLPWLRPHLTKQSNQRSTPQKKESAVLTVVRIIEKCPQARLEGELQSRTGGAAT